MPNTPNAAQGNKYRIKFPGEDVYTEIIYNKLSGYGWEVGEKDITPASEVGERVYIPTIAGGTEFSITYTHDWSNADHIKLWNLKSTQAITGQDSQLAFTDEEETVASFKSICKGVDIGEISAESGALEATAKFRRNGNVTLEQTA